MELTQWKIKTKIGSIYLVASEDGLQGVSLNKFENTPLAKSLKKNAKTHKILSQASTELKEYFEGHRTKFDVPLDISGTRFQKDVWTELQKIPYGKTCSYKDIAINIKNKKAVRAVGNANGQNPFCIIIPCHRVIASDGKLGGYSGGLRIKTKLLKLEEMWSSK